MNSKPSLPRWVGIGASTLACIAGMVNAVGYLGFEHQAVSHMSGTATMLGIAFADGDSHAICELGGVLLAFSFGAMLSGLIIQDSTLRLGRRYGVVLALEAVLLAVSVPLYLHHQLNGALTSAVACGLQNAMGSTYSGSLVRTTHLTGMFTDLGIGLGHGLRRMELPMRRLTLSFMIIVAFLVGGVFGAWLFAALSYYALLVPSALTGVTGVGYTIYRHWSMRQVRSSPA